MRPLFRGLSSLTLAFALASCGGSSEKRLSSPAAPANADVDANGFTAPTAETVRANETFGSGLLDLTEQVDFEEAKRGFVASDPQLQIALAAGKTWSPELFAFVTGDAPPAVGHGAPAGEA